MKNLKIVFYGTPDFATASLQALVEKGFVNITVVTAPDRPAGRGRQLNFSSVKQYALSQGLTVWQPENLKSTDFLEQLQQWAPDLQIVVAFRMLPKAVWALPRLGTFNLHASLLPQYRGAAPINWAIINGETETGVTTFFIDEKIDTGAILLYKKMNISPTDTAGTLHDKLMQIGSDLVLETVEAIYSGQISPQTQPQMSTLKEAPKLTSENTRIDWNGSAQQIFNHIRGLSPYPAAWTHLHHHGEVLLFKIYDSKYHLESHQHSLGKIIADKSTLRVAVTDGYVELLEIQLPGKKKMQVKSFLNGFTFSKESYVS